MSGDHLDLEDARMTIIAKMAAKEAVQETFTALGVNISTADGVLRAQKNFAHLDATRAGVETIKKAALGSLAAGVLTAFGTGLWYAFDLVRAACMTRQDAADASLGFLFVFFASGAWMHILMWLALEQKEPKCTPDASGYPGLAGQGG
jgi:hypothetical protein